MKRKVMSAEKIVSGYSFDFVWNDDYDSQEIEGAIYQVFEDEFNLEVTGIDFHSVDYEDIREFNGQNVSQCSLDFVHNGDYPAEDIINALDDAMIAAGYTIIGSEFYGITY